MKYSIITPVYNSWLLMKKYFESLENQVYKDFEIILIDDKSTDDSFSQINEYKKQSSLTITVIQNEKNSGPGYSRNKGMEIAKGEWITFIDSDDWISKDFFEKLESITQKENCNCIVFDYIAIRKNKEHFMPTVYGNHPAGELNYREGIIDVRNHTFCKLYKKNCLIDKSIIFPELKRCEDVAFVCQALEACKSIFYLKEHLYFYNQHIGSLSTNTKLDERDMINAYDVLYEKLGKEYSEEIKKKSISDLLYGGVLMMCKSKKKSKDIRQFIDNYESRYCDWYKNENLKRLGKTKELYLFFIHYKCVIFLRFLTFMHSLLLK